MFQEPIFFERNRVGRVYLGGKLFADFFGDPPEDGFEPEEWIASGVRAINKVQRSEREGVSRIRNEELYFDDLIHRYPDELLGEGKKLRILVKALDSAVRLPAQVHPDKAFSRAHFNSSYGKTECWLILDTRPGAKLFFGFRDGVTREDLRRAIAASETDRDAMERLLVSVTPEIGGVYFVPAKTPHAIGAGCLILEVQEPTDFTIQPERYCADYRLSDEEMYIGIDPECALDCFSFGKTPDARLAPRTLSVGDGVKVECLVGPEDTDCFVIHRQILTGGTHTLDVPDSYAIYIVIDGEGQLTDGERTLPIRKGDYFFMPAALMGRFRVGGELTLVECY